MDNLNMESKEESEFSPIAKIGDLKNVWVCIGPSGRPDYDTISYLKKDSINKLMSQGYKDWEKRIKEGWRCVKVHITFKEL